MGLWARTVDKTGEGWIQADRGGRPLQAVFLAADSREAYLSGQPADDDRFIKVLAHELEHSGGYAPGDAIAIARKLLPDILSYDARRPTSFPNNGRTLRDDVVDAFFSIYTDGKVAGDSVGPHGDLLDDFPYLGPPHESRRATPISFAVNQIEVLARAIFSEFLVSSFVSTTVQSHAFSTVFRSLGASQKTRETGRKREK